MSKVRKGLQPRAHKQLLGRVCSLYGSLFSVDRLMDVRVSVQLPHMPLLVVTEEKLNLILCVIVVSG